MTSFDTSYVNHTTVFLSEFAFILWHCWLGIDPTAFLSRMQNLAEIGKELQT